MVKMMTADVSIQEASLPDIATLSLTDPLTQRINVPLSWENVCLHDILLHGAMLRLVSRTARKAAPWHEKYGNPAIRNRTTRYRNGYRGAYSMHNAAKIANKGQNAIVY